MIVRVDPAALMLHVMLQGCARSMKCSIGRSGTIAAEAKSEGDGATPIGRWPVRGALLRPDRIPPPGVIGLPWRWLDRADGWSDDPADPAYNRPVRHPHPFSAEHLWREDGLYDAIVVLGHNDAPPRPGAGSAIFLHCWNDARPTEGCVAIPRDALLALLPALSIASIVEIG